MSLSQGNGIGGSLWQHGGDTGGGGLTIVLKMLVDSVVHKCLAGVCDLEVDHHRLTLHRFFYLLFLTGCIFFNYPNPAYPHPPHVHDILICQFSR